MVAFVSGFSTCHKQNDNWLQQLNLCEVVRQLLSLYLRFYKVTMLESTNATDEG
jgi:hypothetical protein